MRLSSGLQAGDLVVAGQGVGEPTPLLRALLDDPAPVDLFVGLSHSDVLRGPVPAPVRLVSFGALGPLRDHDVEVLPVHFLDLPRQLRHRPRNRLVLLVQVSPPDADGRHRFSAAVDHTAELVDDADVIVAEVNDALPTTIGPTLDPARIDEAVATSRPLPTVPRAEPTDVARAIAAHAAALVGDGAALQLGLGAVPQLMGEALADRTGLRVRSTLVGDWLLALDPAETVLSEAAGSPELYAHVAAHARMVGVPEVNTPVDGLVAVNSALEVDLSGAVNAEATARGYVGGIGGQADFLRAAQRSPGGLAVVILPATAERGRRSRIVPTLHAGTVTTPRSCVDVVVTEHGVADLRGRGLRERARALAAIAAPHHRDTLGQEAA
ncbi:acetyl-CoA hydrolase/transferase C-terminal domain-containing protein [Actinomycetospora sp. NBRC 106378]|uniref:acetyl-CoA hydrolase/transferase C-terminal domain-containing protein n=1 Tax=Actinomycetospora sp. NBRC 106378 TaxID=3032208 RepID=UPI0024A189E7|nr:acetyl-CoA hydrolase/transferase C-terminal domain-containing protein [Actinomycetospora sp. NBRC 106378]GLZ51564.1 acetyl-CoA hydrolase [Actinomycetospora sp. NBRC 106378]